MISKVKIFGERCSGTNYLENLILENFKLHNLLVQADGRFVM